MVSIAFYNTIKNQYIYIFLLCCVVAVCVSIQHIIYININRFQIQIILLNFFVNVSGRFLPTFTSNLSIHFDNISMKKYQDIELRFSFVVSTFLFMYE